MSPATESAPEVEKKEPKPEWRIPLLRLRVNDVSSEGSAAFFEHINATTLLREAVVGVLAGLYTPETVPPSVRSVTLVLRSMGGIAYTTGSELDDDHKEIHFSTDYIGALPAEKVKHEILGVVRHEMVHCWQYNGLGACPGGLIEGIADYIRLKDSLAPPHWKRDGKHWDDGYQVTAYFLEWCEQKCGAGFVKGLNGRMKDRKYSPDIWTELSGTSVQELWKEYRRQFDIETHDGSDISEDSGDEGGVDHIVAKGESSDDGSVDVVRREEATEDILNIDGVDDNGLGLDQEGSGDWLPEEKEALFLRHRLQRTFLPPNDEKPNVNEFSVADTYFTFLESMEDVPSSILLKSKLPKVLRFISRLEDPEVVETHYNFKARARALVEKWSAALPKESTEDQIGSPILFDTPTPDDILSGLNQTLRSAVLLGAGEEWLRKEIQREAYEIRRQAGLPRPLAEMEQQDNRALVHVYPVSMSGSDGASDVSESDDEGRIEYEQSYVSTTHDSTIISCASSMVETGSQTSDTGLSHSTPRGIPIGHDMGRRPIVNEMHEIDTSSSSSSSGASTWHSPGIDSISMISRKKLASLKFAGDVDGARFIKEFEKLVDRVQPDMSDDDKRMLLTTSFTGQAVNVWYEELDVDDSMPYEELKAAFIDAFKGMSRRSKKLDGGALIDL